MTHTLAELDQIVGGMTEQMNDKMDTDGRNGTNTVDYVVEWQLPTAENNYSWYRKYKSGWVEQGGIAAGNGTVTLQIPMDNTNYFISLTGAASSIQYSIDYNTKTTSGFTIYSYNTRQTSWEVKGYAAQT